MSETIQEKLAWVIPLLQQWKDGGELRHRDSPDSDIWKPCHGPAFPGFLGPKENYRVLPGEWAWKLVDAEKAGKTIQFKDSKRGWVEVPTKHCEFKLPPYRYQIKPDPEPVTEVLIKEMTAVDFSALLDVLKTIGDRLDRLETRLLG